MPGFGGGYHGGSGGGGGGGVGCCIDPRGREAFLVFKAQEKIKEEKLFIDIFKQFQQDATAESNVPFVNSKSLEKSIQPLMDARVGQKHELSLTYIDTSNKQLDESQITSACDFILRAANKAEEGWLTQEEFVHCVNAWITWTKVLTVLGAPLARNFSRFDTDNDGSLNRKELTELLMALDEESRTRRNNMVYAPIDLNSSVYELVHSIADIDMEQGEKRLLLSELKKGGIDASDTCKDIFSNSLSFPLWKACHTNMNVNEEQHALLISAMEGKPHVPRMEDETDDLENAYIPQIPTDIELDEIMKIADRSGNGKVELEELIPAIALWNENSLHTDAEMDGEKFVNFSKQLKRLEKVLKTGDLTANNKGCSSYCGVQ